MTKELFHAFVEAFKVDKDAQARLAQARTSQEIIRIAKEMGFEFNPDQLDDDIQDLVSRTISLTDEDLESIAGGEGEINVHNTPTHSQRFDLRCCRR